MHFANTAAIALERAQMTREIILRMLRMAEMRDPKETGAHVNRVGAYAAVIYEAWAAKKGVTQTEIDKTKDILRIAAMLHDVGKVAISDTILKKPARLDPEEIVCMKKHTNLGAQLFSDAQSELDSAAYYIALEHHERWDGQGYPGYSAFDDGPASERTGTDGDMHQPKRGQAIHLFGRIVAVADVYDALSSKRCYKESWDEDKVLENLQQESGRQFDPDIVDAFFNVLDQVHHIREQYPDAN
jgi:response regulator RpfG family c-di-GMP phosphodiesterase